MPKSRTSAVWGPILGQAQAHAARWLGAARPTGAAVTAVMLGERCLAARVEAGAAGSADGGGMALVDAREGSADDLAVWRAEGLFNRSQAVLVLRSSERHFLTLDRPEVPPAELALAVRWPLGEALELEPDQLLTTALPLPQINNAARAQVLAVAGRLAVAHAHLATLAAAGIRVRSIDVSDTALRGMRSLLPPDNDGWVVLAHIGNDICIGLLWHGDFCALRTLALPQRQAGDDEAFTDHMALHIQRTTDHFERGATQLGIRHVLAAMPALSAAARDALRPALPLAAQWFDIGQAMTMPPAVLARVAEHNDLTALACVAAARLSDRLAAAAVPASPAQASPADAPAALVS